MSTELFVKRVVILGALFVKQNQCASCEYHGLALAAGLELWRQQVSPNDILSVLLGGVGGLWKSYSPMLVSTGVSLEHLCASIGFR